MSTTKLEFSFETLNIMNESVSLFRQQTMQSRRWEHIHETIDACASVIHLVRAPVVGHPLDGITDSAGLVKRFYNETVGFIMGEKRTINLEVWEGLINDITGYKDKQSWNEMCGSKGSIGANQMMFSHDRSSDFVASSNVVHKGIREDLLLYAHRDILHKWINRQNGIDDMLYSLVLMAKIYSVYRHTSLKG